MSKKSFKDDNPALTFITTTQETQEEQDAQAVQDTQHIQRKKGHKLKRINMAFSDENIEYLQIIARIEGLSQTEYVNKLVAADHATRAEEVEKAKEVLKGDK